MQCMSYHDFRFCVFGTDLRHHSRPHFGFYCVNHKFTKVSPSFYNLPIDGLPVGAIFCRRSISLKSTHSCGLVANLRIRFPSYFIVNAKSLNLPFNPIFILPSTMEGESFSELTPYCESVNIIADTIETRFMVFVPGGENPRYNIEPSERSVGIRFTRRNCAIDKIQSLRADIYRLETENVIGRRKPTSAWRNCFGARNYQPHIKLLWPNNKIDRDLTKLGTVFRSNLDHILFDRFEVKCNWA